MTVAGGGWLSTVGYLEDHQRVALAAEIARGVSAAQPGDPRAFGYARHYTELAEGPIGAIRFTIGLLPAIVALIAMAIFWKYPLTDERFREVRNETEYRKRQRGHLIAPDGHVIEVPKG